MEKFAGNGQVRVASKTRSEKSGPSFNSPRDRFTYALKAYTTERRAKGWFIARTWVQFAGEKPEWIGPFDTIEAACLAIGRRLATEIADRHSMMIAAHKIKPGDPLYGLKPTTRLRQKHPVTSSTT